MRTFLSKFIKTVILLLIILAVIYVGTLMGLFEGVSNFVSPEDEEQRPNTVKTALIARGDLKITVGATGTVKPDLEVIVKSKASGEIINFPFEEGDIVQKGRVVVKLDPKIEKSRVNQAKANLIMAEAKLEKARISLKDKRIRLKRQQTLYNDKIIADQDLDDAGIEFEMSKSDVKIAEAETLRLAEALKEAEDRLDDTEITSPLSGTILEKFVERGQIITSGTSSNTEGTSLFNMADLNKIYISANVDETDVGRVKSGQNVSITVDAYPGWNFKGKVLRIAPKGRVESTITVFDVIIEVVDENKTRLKPAMTANVEVLTEFKQGVLLIPSEAIRIVSGDFGTYILRNEKPAWISLKTGDTDGVFTEIKGDVREGLQVVISGIEDGKIKGSEALKSWSLRRAMRPFRKKR